MWSNFLFSVLLSKLSMTAAFSMVTSAPFFTGDFATAAQISPSFVLSRRYV